MKMPKQEFKTSEAARHFEKRKIRVKHVQGLMKRYAVKFWKEAVHA